ncbi:MAG: hypothetical protein H7Z43_09145 [Clostridia bacterium]|nr:hypothetical protein [Deltaproteobacteria bacterium]
MLVLAACGAGQSLKLEIKAPCNATSLGSNGVAFVELRVESPDLESPFTATFGVSDASGSLDGISLVTKATIEVAGRGMGNNGSPGVALIAGGVGYIDLSSMTDTLGMIAGPVNSFVRTTSTRDGSCSEEPSGRWQHSSNRLSDGRVLVTGGSGDNGVLGDTELYAPADGTFSKGPNLAQARTAHTGTTLKDGKVFIAGGIGLDGKAIATFEVFDGARFTVSKKMSARAHHSATRLTDGRVLLAGGDDSTDVLATSDIYDPSSGSIVKGPMLKIARARHTAVLVDDTAVALIGGVSDDAVLADTEFVDVDAGVSIAGPSLKTARSDAMSTFLSARGAIVVAGGFSSLVDEMARGTATDSIEVIDVSVSYRTATLACSDAKLIEAHAAAVFADIPHGMLIAGGVSSPGQASTTAETLDFEASPCRPTVNRTDGDLFASRYAGSAVVLASGDVLVTGGAGISKGTAVSRSASELFIIER